MQIRERGNTIKLVRTSFDEAGQSVKNEVLATLKRSDLELTEEEREKLTAEELEQFENFHQRALREVNIERNYAAYRFVETLELVSGWLSNAPREEALALSSKAQKALKALRRKIEGLKNTGDEPDANPSGEGKRGKGE
jgi:hypothetical protein